MIEIYHVNFHTFRNEPLFLDATYTHVLIDLLRAVIAEHGIVCLAMTLMPTHVHVIIVTFSDQTRARAVQLLKGASSRAFFEMYPELHDELGGRLWQEGYDWVTITSHQQYEATARYVADNRSKIGLAPIRLAPEIST